ncbi:MFS transporter [Paenibacillus sp. LHD-117]|uniref:MFS transporter n=1 Tax=Paenibacillus sp. LHD-117 TaxID=3071412 RepID=UPI0027DFDDD7|nr:MFS transporter [Paenibacillus sp. LHD-117]MDQ6420621.1 MFS transporter [Paenibacillus sp. LHD-117]
MYRWTVYILAFGVFLTATSELVVSGIMNIIADDLQISLALAGQLVTAYSLAFAIGTPIFVSLTSRMKRRKVLAYMLVVFAAGSSLASFASDIYVLMGSRIILGISSGVFLVAAFGATAKIVPAGKLGSSIATIVMGFSLSLILGVPVGILITEWLNWRAIFLILSAASLIMAYLVYRHVPEIEGDEPVAFAKQFKTLGSAAIVGGLIFTLFRESGGSVLFTYIIPYMQNILRMDPSYGSGIMLAFGLFGAIGSRLGGYGVDRWGAGRVILVNLVIQILAIAAMPLFSHSTAVGILLIGVMIFIMFATGPAVQSYFIQQAPRSTNLVLSLNTSVVHLGLAAGAGAGGYLVDASSTLRFHPWLSASLLLISLAVIASFAYGRKKAFSGPARLAKEG